MAGTHWRQSRKDVRHSGNKNYPLSTKSTEMNDVQLWRPCRPRQIGDKVENRLSTFSPVCIPALIRNCISLSLSTTAEIVKLAASKRKKNDEGDGVLSSAMTSHIICCLDTLSANYDGLPAVAAQYAAKFQLLARLHATLTIQSFDQRASCFSNSRLTRTTETVICTTPL